MYKHQYNSTGFPVHINYRPVVSALNNKINNLSSALSCKASNLPELLELMAEEQLEAFIQKLTNEGCIELGELFARAYDNFLYDESKASEQFIAPILALLEKGYVESYDLTNQAASRWFKLSELRFNETITQAYMDGNIDLANRVTSIINHNQPWSMECTINFLGLCAENNKPELINAVADSLCKDSATQKMICKKLGKVTLKPAYYQTYVSYCDLVGWVDKPAIIEKMSFAFFRAAHKIDGDAQSARSVLSFLKGLSFGSQKISLLLSHHQDDFTKTRWEDLISSKLFKENEELVKSWELESYTDCLADEARIYTRG